MSLRAVARAAVVSLVAVLLAVGVLAGYRAMFPVKSVTIALVDSALRAGSGVRVDTVASGRAPISIRVEIVQGSHSETMVLDRIVARRWPFWDTRLVQHSTYAMVSQEMIGRFDAGPATLRATVTGTAVWKYRPAPVIREVTAAVPRSGVEAK
jgi:hypothetical protein